MNLKKLVASMNYDQTSDLREEINIVVQLDHLLRKRELELVPLVSPEELNKFIARRSKFNAENLEYPGFTPGSNEHEVPATGETQRLRFLESMHTQSASDAFRAASGK